MASHSCPPAASASPQGQPSTEGPAERRRLHRVAGSRGRSRRSDEPPSRAPRRASPASARVAGERLCVLVVIGVNARGKKHFLAIEDGVRESTQSWREVLLGMKQRGFARPAKLAVGDGALGFWSALSEVYPACPVLGSARSGDYSEPYWGSSLSSGPPFPKTGVRGKSKMLPANGRVAGKDATCSVNLASCAFDAASSLRRGSIAFWTSASTSPAAMCAKHVRRSSWS